jgi:hypothetical protein
LAHIDRVNEHIHSERARGGVCCPHAHTHCHRRCTRALFGGSESECKLRACLRNDRLGTRLLAVHGRDHARPTDSESEL